VEELYRPDAVGVLNATEAEDRGVGLGVKKGEMMEEKMSASSESGSGEITAGEEVM
jgi:hypothetical protein